MCNVLAVLLKNGGTDNQISSYLKKQYTTNELKHLRNVINNILGDGLELQDVLNKIEAKLRGDEILKEKRDKQIKDNLTFEIEDWDTLGYKVEFVSVGIKTICLLIPKTEHLEVLSASVNLAEGDEYDEDIGRLLALLKVGYGNDVKRELRNRDLKWLL